MSSALDKPKWSLQSATHKIVILRNFEWILCEVYFATTDSHSRPIYKALQSNYKTTKEKKE